MDFYRRAKTSILQIDLQEKAIKFNCKQHLKHWSMSAISKLNAAMDDDKEDFSIMKGIDGAKICMC